MLRLLSIPLTLALAACTARPPTIPARSDTIALRRHGLFAEFNLAIDRITFFGRSGGGNLLHLSDLTRDLPGDGSYTFWGGCYTWIAPQKAVEGTSLGWVAEDRASKKDWPPDPAMDIGPVRCTARTPDSFTVLGPEQRTGLREEKTFRLHAPDRASLEFTLHNRGVNPVTACPWITTAASLDDAIAVRMPPRTELWGWDQKSIDSFRSITSPPNDEGWALVRLARSRWGGGIKVYLAPPPGSPAVEAEIAIWSARANAWLHRSMGPMSAEEVAALRAAGEGPVALYIQPNKGNDPIIEAELYGPLRVFPPDSAHTAAEIWRIIPSATPDLARLP
jgi:hypothetical protein